MNIIGNPNEIVSRVDSLRSESAPAFPAFSISLALFDDVVQLVTISPSQRTFRGTERGERSDTAFFLRDGLILTLLDLPLLRPGVSGPGRFTWGTIAAPDTSIPAAQNH